MRLPLSLDTIGFFATVSAFLLISSAASAQTPSDIPPSQIPQVPRTPNESLEPQTGDRPEQELEVPDGIFPPQVFPEEGTLFVSEFEFLDNTVLSNEQLREIAAPYINREITFAELLQFQAEVSDLYVERGYTTAEVYIPIENNQNIDLDAVVFKVQIFEGTVEAVEINGDARLHRYVRERLAPALGPLNQPALEEALRQLSVDPLIENISANLSTGTQIGSSILTVQVSGESNFIASVGTDNQRAPAAGSIQREAQLSAANLLALGETFRVGYSNTDGSNGFRAGVEVPVNANDGTIAFDYSQLDGRIVEEPIDEFDIRSDSRVYTLSFQQPLVRSVSNEKIEEFSIGAAASRLESTTTLSGFPFPLSPGANDDGETRITELSLFQEYARQGEESALFAQSRFNFGINAFGSTAGTEPNGQYLSWRGQIAWLSRVFGSSQLLVSGDVQLSPDQLVPISQFSLGGPKSIRGYRQDALIADSGLIAAVELAIPVLEFSDDQQISVIPFAGAGFGWNNGAERALDESFLAAVGLGLQYELAGFTARLNYAVPLTDRVGLQGDSLQENGFDFDLGYQLRF
ncbi:MAG: ShlB/FhaC/HecB family hemolysin secretion/activation protein [Phormidesmis sp.]